MNVERRKEKFFFFMLPSFFIYEIDRLILFFKSLFMNLRSVVKSFDIDKEPSRFAVTQKHFEFIKEKKVLILKLVYEREKFSSFYESHESTLKYIASLTGFR